MRLNLEGLKYQYNTHPPRWRRVTNGWIWHGPDGPWYRLPAPGRLHRCWTASQGIIGYGLWRELIERCPCGAIRRQPVHLDHAEPSQGYYLDPVVNDRPRWRDRGARRRGTAVFLTTY